MMRKSSPNVVVGISMAVMAVVLCAAIVMMMEYAKTEIKVRKAQPRSAPPAAPAGPYAERIEQLSRQEYFVTQSGGDDRASLNRYHNFNEPGLYLDVVSDKVLFSSLDKLESTQGFAEFAKPFDPGELLEKEATVNGEHRLHVHSKSANSYLGWIITDADRGGARRYVINSSALKFVAVAELEKSGLAQHRPLFGATEAK